MSCKCTCILILLISYFVLKYGGFYSFLKKNSVYVSELSDILFFTFLLNKNSIAYFHNILCKIEQIISLRDLDAYIYHGDEYERREQDILTLLNEMDSVVSFKKSKYVKCLILDFLLTLIEKYQTPSFTFIQTSRLQKMREIIKNRNGKLSPLHSFIYRKILQEKGGVSITPPLSRRFHIGLILDGNRRFAKVRNLSNGHLYGAMNATRILHTLFFRGIKECTLYVLSYDNFLKRSSMEKRIIFELIEIMLDSFYLYDSSDTRYYIRFIGEWETTCPHSVQHYIRHIMDKMKDRDESSCFTVNYAIGYDGKREIEQACHQMRADSRLSLSRALWLPNNIDLVLRTGNTRRMSGFFPLQTSYAEWFFLTKQWPELSEKDVHEILDEYEKMEFNFGK